MRIGEVASRSGVSARMLRHYEAVGLVTPSGRSSAGYREYGADDIVRIFHVESLRALGLSLREVRQALDDPTFAPGDVVADLAARTEQRIDRERDLLERLRRVADSGPDDWEQVLDVVALLSGLDSEDPSGRQRAALAGDSVAGEVLARAVLAESDLNVAGALRWALSRSGDDATDVLASVLADDDVEVRRRAVLALLETPGENATAALRSAVSDTDPGVRSRAVLGLADRGERDVVPELIDLVVDGVADVDAAEALASIAGGDAVEGLVARLGDDAAVRRRIAQALGEIGGAAADSALRDLVDDPDAGVTVIAKYLLTDR
ncbi:HEAT repeat domain-containing protein [Gordonia sp. HY442]|uniref:HEAT repeat domain-containing protein n=1 Tax=Gordonia zhenghanii TaxID=2911516 RepID=UPI001F234C04|nr:HEAT repeat domain-containing protein [Gordonia zhenghanii]MCF8604256.1 HEAT repeat domain-containing protein [Gordonia zhenghanii]